MKREPSACLILEGHRVARLYRIGSNTRIGNFKGRYVGGASKFPLDVPGAPALDRETNILAGILPNERRVCFACVGKSHALQWFIVNRNQFGCVLGLQQTFCHDYGHRLAHVADLFSGKNSICGPAMPASGWKYLAGQAAKPSLYRVFTC